MELTVGLIVYSLGLIVITLLLADTIYNKERDELTEHSTFRALHAYIDLSKSFPDSYTITYNTTDEAIIIKHKTVSIIEVYREGVVDREDLVTGSRDTMFIKSNALESFRKRFDALIAEEHIKEEK